MRKRERENPCEVCGHYHEYEEGEVCSICGHRLMVGEKTSVQVNAFPTMILPEFLYLGSYDNASCPEFLKTQGITHILNTVPLSKPNIYHNSSTYHCLQDDKTLPFDEAIQFLEKCKKDKARVLVHCMSGKNTSPAIVIAYMMKTKGWRLAQCYQWVKERRPSVELTEDVHQQLQELENKIFGSNDGGSSVLSSFPPSSSINFGFPKINDSPPLPAFSGVETTSIFAQPPLTNAPTTFTFGAVQSQNSATGSSYSANAPNPDGTDIKMDGS